LDTVKLCAGGAGPPAEALKNNPVWDKFKSGPELVTLTITGILIGEPPKEPVIVTVPVYVPGESPEGSTVTITLPWPNPGRLPVPETVRKLPPVAEAWKDWTEEERLAIGTARCTAGDPATRVKERPPPTAAKVPPPMAMGMVVAPEIGKPGWLGLELWITVQETV
jgi:hypothetical protein